MNMVMFHYESGGGANLHGVSWDDLKFAIRIDTIIQAISSNYGIFLLVMISLQVQIHLTIIYLCGYIERKEMLHLVVLEIF